MTIAPAPSLREAPAIEIKHPINVASRHFTDNKQAHYKWLREEAPVYKGKVAVINAYFMSRYEDCTALLQDPRFVRNRTTATGGSRIPIPLPMPRSISLLANSMIIEDDPGHHRMRSLVQKAFTPGSISQMENRIERLTHQLLDEAEKQGQVDLIKSFALPIPVTVISEMMGVSDEDMPHFSQSLKVLTDGMSGWNLLRTFFWDLGRTVKFVQGMIERKRGNPGDDILTGLIQAEEEGDKLSDDELLSMVFLLVFAGYETTVHLITNGVLTLLQHPEQLERLRAQPELMESAVEEVLRFQGPIHGTKPNYAIEDVTLHDVTIPKGSAVMPLLASANRDPAVFDDPDIFDIARTPNKHLAFGHGKHFCLGAPLARMETRIALTNLLKRNPNLRLAVEPEQLTLQNIPLWHRYQSLPVALG